MSKQATDLIVRIAVENNDTPVRPLADIADDILRAGIDGVVSARALVHDGWGNTIETGTEWVA